MSDLYQSVKSLRSFIETHVSDGKIDEANVLLENLEAQVELLNGRNSLNKLVYENKIYREIFKNTLTGIGLATLDGRIIECNSALLKIFGYDSFEELNGLRGYDLYVIKEDWKKDLEELKRNGNIVNRKIQLYNRFGKILNCIINTRLLYLNKKPFIIADIEDVTEQKEIKLKFDEQKTYLQTLLNSMNSGVVVIDPETFEILDANQYALRLLGHNLNELKGTECFKVICTRGVESCPLTQNNGKLDYIETTFRTASGGYIEVIKSVENVQLNEKVFWLVTFTDITALREVEKSMKEISHSEANLKLLIDKSPSFITILNTDKYFYVNNSWSELTGYSPNEAYKLNPFEVIHPEYRDEMKQRGNARLNAENVPTQYDMKIITKSGDVKWINISGSLIEYKGEKASLAIGHEITDLVKARKLLKNEMEKFRSIFESSHSIMMIINPETGHIVDANPVTCKYYGYSKAHLTTMLISDINMLSEEEVYNEMQLVKNNNRNHFYFKHKLASGEVRDVEVYSGNVVINNETMLFSVIHDISEKKIAEEALRNSELKLRNLNAQKDKFFSIIGHDLKGPIGNIGQFIELIKLKLEEGDIKKVAFYVDHMDKLSKRTYKLIENLLIWSRSQIGTLKIVPEKLDLKSELVSAIDILEDVALEKNILINLDIPSELTVFVDQFTLHTLFRNLITNAIKFSFRGSVIDLSLKKKNSEKIIELYIRDYGIGISAKIKENLFKIDHSYSNVGTENEKGTGLGLILCQDLIRRNKGDLWLVEQNGEGCTFAFSMQTQPWS